MIDAIQLERVSGGDRRYREIRSRHYVADRGTIGRSLRYLIHYRPAPNGIAGIIAGASCSFSALRNPFFGFDFARAFGEWYANEHEEEIKPFDLSLLPTVINNSVFRLTYNEHGLASRVLAAWRDRVQDDWMSRYWMPRELYESIPVLGFETFIEPYDHGNGKRRDGGCYRFDGWKQTGTTSTGKLVYCRHNERFFEWLNGGECLIPCTVAEVLNEMYQRLVK